jgi:hypothetical protein
MADHRLGRKGDRGNTAPLWPHLCSRSCRTGARGECIWSRTKARRHKGVRAARSGLSFDQLRGCGAGCAFVAWWLCARSNTLRPHRVHGSRPSPGKRGWGEDGGLGEGAGTAVTRTSARTTPGHAALRLRNYGPARRSRRRRDACLRRTYTAP